MAKQSKLHVAADGTLVPAVPTSLGEAKASYEVRPAEVKP